MGVVLCRENGVVLFRGEGVVVSRGGVCLSGEGVVLFGRGPVQGRGAVWVGCAVRRRGVLSICP